ncbi:MAG: tryptophan halogenase family protein [Halieaceae bacterium]
MDKAVKKVLILGGGSAGWLTAGVIAAEHGAGLELCLVESPDVPTIGVGEGTWPSMRDTLRKMGVAEQDFIRECDASFKQGSKFVAWNTGDASDFYYHPFSLPQGFFEVNSAPFWQSRASAMPFADAVSPQVQVCERGLAPKQVATPGYAAVVNYAYHLDAVKFGHFLRKHCTEKLGVTHVVDHVQAVNSSADGDIESLATAGHGSLAADLFIDCSGGASVLLGKHFDEPFVSRQSVLFNDRALAVQVPYADKKQAIASATLSTAQRAGWVWDIGLPTRRGVGYVYSSAHSSDSQAEQDLRAYLEPSVGKKNAGSAELRQLKINPGHRAAFWRKNCVAVGMSAGFIEPLEASALALVELSAAMIRDSMPANRALMDIAARRFNERFLYRWDRVIDFLKLHYVLSQRRDSDYWRDHCDPASIPERLQELLQLWRYQTPSRLDFVQTEEIFPAASYQYVLYGMGFKSEPGPGARRSEDAALAQQHFDENAAQTQRLLQGLPPNRELLDALRQGA